MKNTNLPVGNTASEQISSYIAELGDWRGIRIAQLRQLILEAAPGVVEEWKWDTPVWSYNGNLVAAAAFQNHIKLNFFKGATLADPQQLFNAGLEAKATRAIDFHEQDQINETALKALIQAAVAQNGSKSKGKK